MNNKRPVKVILLDQAKIQFEELNRIAGEQHVNGISNSDEIQLLKSIKQKSELLKTNPTYGDKIPRELIPKNLNVSNLFRVELTGYWRMLYALDGNQIEIVAFILYLINHPTYNKLFGYRKK
ncbi:MAG: hypothetical protein ABID61_06460 [Candidatus Micrarchaeota archaeon]